MEMFWLKEFILLNVYTSVVRLVKLYVQFILGLHNFSYCSMSELLFGLNERAQAI